MASYLDGVILGISLTLPLGPVTIEILRRGLMSGWRESLKTVAGAFSAELTFFFAVFFGLAKVVENRYVSLGLGGLGVFFLLYLGYGSIKDFLSKKDSTQKKALGKNSFAAGFGITLFSPLNLFMWVGIIGGFFGKDVTIKKASSVLVGILPSLLTYSALSIGGKKFVSKKRMKYVSLAAGIFLLFYGLKLAFDLARN